MKTDFTIREAQQTDTIALKELFQNTVLAVNSKDYSQAEVEDWASCGDDLSNIEEMIKTHYFIVAVNQQSQIVGFIIRKTKCSPLFKRSDISCKTKRPPKNNFPQHSKDSKKASENFVSPDAFFFKFRWLCQLKFVPLYSVRVVFVHHSNTI